MPPVENFRFHDYKQDITKCSFCKIKLTDNIITFIYFRVDQYFRIYFEQKIRSKTGSHIGPKIKPNRKPCDYEGLKSQFTEKGLSAYP